MSTLEDLDAAVRAHSAQERPGQLVVGWALVVATTEDDDEYSRYDTVTPASQPAHHTLGLLSLGEQFVREQRE